jgi:hypothetical protein
MGPMLLLLCNVRFCCSDICRRCCCCCCCCCSQAGAARPEIVAEVASSLADMLYATQKMEGAKEALQVGCVEPTIVAP